MTQKYYNEPEQVVLAKLTVDAKQGLSSKEVEKRRQVYGENEFTKPKEKSLLSEIKDVLTQQLIVILLIAAGISFLIQEYADAVGICIAILLGGLIGILTENRSKKAAEALARITSDIEVKVLREGKKTLIHKTELVPGDIVVLESGDMVPADGRIIACKELRVREDMLTGESDDVVKHVGIVERERIERGNQIIFQDPVPAKQTNMLFGGTLIAYGSGIMIVTAIGDQTEMGSIAKELGEKEVDTPLEIKMGHLGEMISKISTAIAGMLFIYMLIQIIKGTKLQMDFSSLKSFLSSLAPIQSSFPDIKTAFVVCIALIVAAVPEGLATMINITLAIAMQQMAKINVLVRKKEACETIGGVSVICSDKTGTLTQNRMTVEELYLQGKNCDKKDIHRYSTFLHNVMLNTTADLERVGQEVRYMGSATECALLLLCEEYPFRQLRQDVRIVKQIPFSSQTKYMMTAIEYNGAYEILSKGAPEVILNQCAYEFKDGQQVPLTASRKETILKEISAFQAKAMRALAFAVLKTDSKEMANRCDTVQGKLIFEGFVGIKDPLREGVKESIKQAYEAGIETKILTGDHINTAIAIGEELGLLKTGKRAVEANYIDTLSDEELSKEISSIAIVARSKPTTKMRIVQILQKNNEIVAVTGDGINDAPALTKADVGIAMGIAGTEVSKNAADIILTDDSFSTIVEAIKWGRGIYNNFQRFIQFQLSVNIIAFLIAIITQIIGKEMPFSTIHLLWINIIMDGPPALALGLEPVRDTVMKRKPTARDASIINPYMIRTILTNSLYITGLLYAQIQWDFLGVGTQTFSGSASEMQTALFSLFAFSVLFNALNCREFGTGSIFPNLLKNKLVLEIIGITGVVQILMTQYCGKFFSAVPLAWSMWGRIILIASSIVVVNEIVKVILRITKKSTSCVINYSRGLNN